MDSRALARHEDTQWSYEVYWALKENPGQWARVWGPVNGHQEAYARGRLLYILNLQLAWGVGPMVEYVVRGEIGEGFSLYAKMEPTLWQVIKSLLLGLTKGGTLRVEDKNQEKGC